MVTSSFVRCAVILKARKGRRVPSDWLGLALQRPVLRPLITTHLDVDSSVITASQSILCTKDSQSDVAVKCTPWKKMHQCAVEKKSFCSWAPTKVLRIIFHRLIGEPLCLLSERDLNYHGDPAWCQGDSIIGCKQLAQTVFRSSREGFKKDIHGKLARSGSEMSREPPLAAFQPSAQTWRILQNKHGACLWTLNPCEWISLYEHTDCWSWRHIDPAVHTWLTMTGTHFGDFYV